MSYFRWSSLGGQSDLYAYADISGGVTLHVRSLRRVLHQGVPEDPTPKLMCEEITPEAWYRLKEKRNALLDACPLVPIGLSRDGMSWNLDFDEAANLVASLRAEGYCIPPGVEDDIREDGLEHEK